MSAQCLPFLDGFWPVVSRRVWLSRYLSKFSVCHAMTKERPEHMLQKIHNLERLSPEVASLHAVQ